MRISTGARIGQASHPCRSRLNRTVSPFAARRTRGGGSNDLVQVHHHVDRIAPRKRCRAISGGTNRPSTTCPCPHVPPQSGPLDLFEHCSSRPTASASPGSSPSWRGPAPTLADRPPPPPRHHTFNDTRDNHRKARIQE